MLWRLQLQLQTFSHFTGKRHIKVLDMYTLLYLKWITNKDLLYCTGNSAQCYEAVGMGGEFGGEWIQVHVWLSPFTIHLKWSQYCLWIGYTPIQNKKLKKSWSWDFAIPQWCFTKKRMVFHLWEIKYESFSCWAKKKDYLAVNTTWNV